MTKKLSKPLDRNTKSLKFLNCTCKEDKNGRHKIGLASIINNGKRHNEAPKPIFKKYFIKYLLVLQLKIFQESYLS